MEVGNLISQEHYVQHWRSVVCESSAKLKNGETQMKDFQFADKGAKTDFKPRSWQPTRDGVRCARPHRDGGSEEGGRPGLSQAAGQGAQWAAVT